MPTSEQIDNIRWALAEYRKTIPGAGVSRDQLFQLYLDYYEGRHKLTFATKKFRDTFGQTFQAMAENLCPIVVDVVADRLQVQSHTSRNKRDARKIEAETQEIARRNRLDQLRGQIYRDALLFGENYVIVWPDAEDETQPVIYPNAPGSIVVKFDPQKLGMVAQAAKFWIEDKHCRLNIYFPDRIEKYVTSVAAEGLPFSPQAFTQYNAPDERWPLPNPYGRVPVFVYTNNAGVGQPGRSELRDIIQPQNGLNKALCDMLVAMEFEAFAQRWVTGLEVDKDDDGVVIPPFKAGIDRVWHVLEKDAKLGEFSRADLKQFVEVQNSLRASIARISGFPLHFFMIGQETPPSGTSLIIASTRLTSKVEDRQISFGETDEDIMRFCLTIRGLKNVDVKQVWKDTSPQLDDTAVWEAANKQMMVTGRNQTLRDRGFTDEEIQKMAAERWTEEMGDGAPALTGVDEIAPGADPADAPATADIAPASDGPVLNEDGSAEAGVVTSQTLNGAQIASALQVLTQFRLGELYEQATAELLVALGMMRDRVAAVIAEIKAKVKREPKPQPTDPPSSETTIAPGSDPGSQETPDDGTA